MRFLSPLLALLLAACATPDAAPPRMVAPVLVTAEAADEYSFARPEQARVTHLSLDLDLDFASQAISGTAVLDILAAPGARELVLDSDGLRIAAVTDAAGQPLAFTIGERVAGKGEPLHIAIGAARQVTITYAAAPAAVALQWLGPAQTAGGKHPFLFSQGQEILNRSWIPTQDSPGIRQSWDARITAPAPLTVVMSGIAQVPPQELGDGRRAFRFVMERPVAPYLIAIAAGEIAFAPLGPRSGVWAEPPLLPTASAELVDTEAMIAANEALYGPYQWGRYDMIVLPPAFPYGGMENPVMTFLTPTFIAGDRSLTGLVAHELAHSWSGNLVNYASWRDMWLNEGVTSYIEGRVSEVVFGPRRAAQERALSFAAVEDALAQHGAAAPVTALRTPAGTDPLRYNSSIVYDKGALFLHTLEAEIGRARFDPWLRGWFDRHAFQPATGAMFLADLRANLIAGDAALEARLGLDEWVYAPGLPANVARPDPAVFAAVDGAAAAYAANGALDVAAWHRWTTAERQRFLSTLPDAIGADDLARLDRALGLSTSGNNELRFLWLRTALRNRFDPAVSQAEEFLAHVGRNKFVEPLFVTLMGEEEWGKAHARRIYAATRGGYHAYTRGNVDRVLGVGE